MTEEEFYELLTKEPALGDPVRRASAVAAPSSYMTGIEVGAAAMMFPLVSFVIKEIGLPWMYEARRYSELWRDKFHTWIDTEYAKSGRDPDRIEKAGDALRAELSKSMDPAARAAWEQFAKRLGH
jgi:hypothetical protein